MFYALLGKRGGRIVTGCIGILAGFVFLTLNLSDPASATGSDWLWCAVGFIVGAILLALGIFKSDRS